MTNTTNPEITVAEITDRGIPGVRQGLGTLYVAHGPDGHTWLLKRGTEAAAHRDGLAYFLATRELDAAGRWVLSGSVAA